MNNLYARIALVLNWSLEQCHSTSLQGLRDLVRPVDAALAEDISRVIQAGEYIAQPKPVKPAKPASRPLWAIAKDIRKAWGTKVNYAAAPYLNAMLEAETVQDDCGYDSMKSIVLYFLNNASTFRGPEAKALKAELKQLVGVK